jgi:hypothetical protein
MVNSIVDRSIRTCLLRRSVISVVCRVVRGAIIGGGAGMHLSVVVIVTSGVGFTTLPVS